MKNILTRILAVAFIFCILTQNAAAVNTGEEDTARLSIASQIDLINASQLSSEQKEIALHKLLYGYPSSDSARSVQSSTLSGYRVLKQVYRNYCVAATCQAIQIYLGGGAPGQEYIGGQLGLVPNGSGSNITNAMTYLNSGIQESNYYVRRYASSLYFDQFYNDVQASISSGIPVYISTELSEDDGWEYDSSGHAMSIYGVTSSSMKIADSYIQWVDSSADMLYSMPSTTVHKAVCNRGMGYLI